MNRTSADVAETKKAAPVADDWLATIDAMNAAGGLKKQTKTVFGSEVSLVSRATSHNTNRSKLRGDIGRGHGSESSRSEDTTSNVHIDSVAEAQQRAKSSRFPNSHRKYPQPPNSYIYFTLFLFRDWCIFVELVISFKTKLNAQ